MQIKCTRDVLIQGVPHEACSVVEVSEKIGLQLINIGKAQPVGDAETVKGDRAVGLTTKSAGALLKRGAKKKAK